MDEIIRELQKRGWVIDGRTQSKTVRIPTRRVPLFGKSGGELATFGSRIRLFRKGLYVTVGKQITFFYVKGVTGVVSKARVKTTLQDVVAAEQKMHLALGESAESDSESNTFPKAGNLSRWADDGLDDSVIGSLP